MVANPWVDPIAFLAKTLRVGLFYLQPFRGRRKNDPVQSEFSPIVDFLFCARPKATGHAATFSETEVDTVNLHRHGTHVIGSGAYADKPSPQG